MRFPSARLTTLSSGLEWIPRTRGWDFALVFLRRGVFESRDHLFCAGNEGFEDPSNDMHEVFGIDVHEGGTRMEAAGRERKTIAFGEERRSNAFLSFHGRNTIQSMTEYKKKMREKMAKWRRTTSNANYAKKRIRKHERPSKKGKHPTRIQQGNPKSTKSPSEETLKKTHENLMVLDKALAPSLSPPDIHLEGEEAVDAEEEVNDEEDMGIFHEENAKETPCACTPEVDMDDGGTREDQEDVHMMFDSPPPNRLGLPLFEHVGEAIAILEEVKEEENAKRAICGKWGAFTAHVADLVRQKRRAAKLCIPRGKYLRMLESSGPLPTRDLKRVKSLDYLVKVPAQNKRRTPPRLVPCVEDWVHVLAGADEDSYHASNALGLYRAMQRKGFGVPGLEICQLWVDYCEDCKRNEKESAKNDSRYKHFLTRELIDRFRGGANNLRIRPPK